MVSGELLRVLTTDPTTQGDVQKLCHFVGHELVSECINTELNTWEFVVRKA